MAGKPGNIRQLVKDFSRLRVLIIGDVMVDSYMWGRVERISPEAPVPIVSLDHKEQRIGGAGNVAINCCGLGAKVFLLGITGNDDEADQLEQLLKENLIDTTGLVKSAKRTTTNKTRIISTEITNSGYFLNPPRSACVLILIFFLPVHFWRALSP